MTYVARWENETLLQRDAREVLPQTKGFWMELMFRLKPPNEEKNTKGFPVPSITLWCFKLGFHVCLKVNVMYTACPSQYLHLST